jgi:O-antigen/teichoic acid export membrane protein
MAFSCKMLFTYIFNNINNNIFSLLLGRLYNKTEAGIYSQAQKWNVMGSNTITGMVQGVAQPTFVQVGDDKERLCRAFSKMLRFTCFISFPAMLGLALIAQEFIIITVTEKWLPSASLMQLLCIAGAFLPLATLYYNMIISRGKSDIYMWNVIIQGCVILGSLLTVHYLGGTIRDMVIAYVIVVISWTLVWHFFVNREIGFSWYQALKDILPFFFIAAFTMAVTHHISLLITEIPLYLMLVRIFLAAIIYLGIIYLSGAKILRQSWEYIRHKQV